MARTAVPTAVLTAVLAAVAGGTAPPAAARTPQPRCGTTLTQDTTLTADLRCPRGDGLVLAAGVVLDLAGHTLHGGGGGTGLRVTGEEVVVRDGRLRGWGAALVVDAAGDLPGADVRWADVLVQDLRLEFSVTGLDVRDTGSATARRVTLAGNGTGVLTRPSGWLRLYSATLTGNGVGAEVSGSTAPGPPLALMRSVVHGNGTGLLCTDAALVLDSSVVTGNEVGARFTDCGEAALRRSVFAANDVHAGASGPPVLSACTTYLGGPAPTGLRRVPCGSPEQAS